MTASTPDEAAAKSEDLAYALTRAARQVKISPDATEMEAIAVRQSIEMESRRLMNVALRRERDAAVFERDAALDMVVQYAHLAGVKPPAEAIRNHIQTVRDLLPKWERTAGEQESRRLANLGLSRQLADLAVGARTFSGGITDLAKQINDALGLINSAQHPPKKVGLLFEIPDPPTARIEGLRTSPEFDQPDLFSEDREAS
ncbi:hypothetical protein [Pseudonocardia sp. D17]|uniref:hypothetical protein n=1 Tax=Pseudonocardia sp. D17 TaxID=882661 RepID=UPI002B3E7206|nr:hypothetical protein PSD17_55240 [Pseudonocardia sp. D17]